MYIFTFMKIIVMSLKKQQTFIFLL